MIEILLSIVFIASVPIGFWGMLYLTNLSVHVRRSGWKSLREWKRAYREGKVTDETELEYFRKYRTMYFSALVAFFLSGVGVSIAHALGWQEAPPHNQRLNPIPTHFEISILAPRAFSVAESFVAAG